MCKRRCLLLMKFQFKFLEASTSTEIRNNGKIDNNVYRMPLMMMQISPIWSSQEPHDKKLALEGVVGACSLISWIWRQLAKSVTNLGDLR